MKVPRLSVTFLCLLILSLGVPLAAAPQQRDASAKPDTGAKEDPQQRATSLRAICAHLGVGTGAVIADIGAGTGRDSWTFAEIVGETGKIYSEEIEESKCRTIREEAEKRGLQQVVAVLGSGTSPELPPNSADMAFMHHVYHHVSHPRDMLRGIWLALKPGGYLVIVDQRLGTLVDWVPREERAQKHFWTAETTVVREARETGFAFVQYAESLWHAQQCFVLIFQRSPSLAAPDRDPDPWAEIPGQVLDELLPPPGQSYRRVAFVALGEGRALIGPLLQAAPCEAADIILEEWATQKDERPPQPAGTTLTSVLTDKGDPQLGTEPLDAVFFLDTYHLLFHGPALLKHLQTRLTDGGRIHVLDRTYDKELTHREASHRRRIPRRLVIQEMEQAGFVLVRETPVSGGDRFLLVFGLSPR